MLIVGKEKKRNGHIFNVCDKHTIVGQYNDKSPVYFDEIADVIYDLLNIKKREMNRCIQNLT